MKSVFYTFLFFIFLISANKSFSTYYIRGENISGTFYLYAHSKSDSLDFIKLFNSKGKDSKANIAFSKMHFIPDGRPNIEMIKLEYSFNIPNDFDLSDSLFRFGFRTRQQYDTTFDYPFYILSELPISDLNLIYPKNNSTDIILQPLFQWSEESHPAIRSYLFQLSTNEDFSTKLIDTLLFTTKYSPKFELQPSTKYYWRVKSEFKDNNIGFRTFSFISGVKTIWSSFQIDKYHYAQDIQQMDSTKLILADHQVGFLISDDYGINWTGVKTENIISFKITPKIDGKMYATCYDLNDSRYKMLRTENDGYKWDFHYTFPQELAYQTDKKMHYIIKDDKFMIAYVNQLMIFDNIESMNLLQNIKLDTSFITSFVELENGDIIAVTESRYVKGELDKGDIFKISNNGNTIKKVFNDYNNENINFLSLNLLENGYLIASGIQNYSDSSFHFISQDEGETWQLASNLNKAKLGSVISTNDGYLFSSYYGSKEPIMMSQDYGYTWVNISGNMPTNNTAWDIKILGDSTFYFLSNSNILYRTNIRKDIEMILFPIDEITQVSDEINFQWQINRRAEKYNIQISDNKEFKNTGTPMGDNLFIDFETESNNYNVDGFNKNQKYYWRVRPYYENKWMKWSDIIEFQLKDPTSVEYFEANENIIYPNPATDFIALNSSNKGLKPFATNDLLIEIYDVMGVLIQYTSVETISYAELSFHELSLGKIDVSNLPPGVYFLNIVGSNGACSIVEKFVKY